MYKSLMLITRRSIYLYTGISIASWNEPKLSFGSNMSKEDPFDPYFLCFLLAFRPLLRPSSMSSDSVKVSKFPIGPCMSSMKLCFLCFLLDFRPFFEPPSRPNDSGTWSKWADPDNPSIYGSSSPCSLVLLLDVFDFFGPWNQSSDSLPNWPGPVLGDPSNEGKSPATSNGASIASWCPLLWLLRDFLFLKILKHAL